MSQTAAIPLSGMLDRPVLRGREVTRSETVLAWTVAAVAAVLLGAAALFLSSGGRWFVVETPSMGEAAPVGTLVLDLPVDVATLSVGDIVSFETSANPDVVYTHRIVSIDADGGLHTRGDVNGAVDPWTLTQADVIGTPALLVPHIGWLLRAAPILLIGTLIILTLTSAFTDRVTRTCLRIAGGALTTAYAAFVFKPFVNVTTITNTSSPTGVEATVISSGIFPVRVDAHGGNSVHLVDGEMGKVVIHELTENGHYQLMSNIDLDPLGWVALIAVCLVPLVACLAVGRVEAVRPS
ncbi:S26 family signal peptidase [Curtobacterium aurantiacum]|uniref:S26 family signal peptidase n=1 Tax=Curtobacterium aurantiacum TaxID=3236919 RepID=A0ABS5VL82_9MICO|nr:S26 family signal peptidase [Curtobacterium flaccumfaciens]MBT1547108.1 S26 family signal peptidase [Curtobacterium flaccumfaciens pv. flaccumfaciens]MBT1589650.1 S26 family signal peptidase [Curtobacterium flaccumfaciens pv. flaccumfaciens]